MSRKYNLQLEAILFDLDNTLIDYMAFRKETVHAAVSAMIGQGLAADCESLYARVSEIYAQHGIEYCGTYGRVLSDFGLDANEFEMMKQTAIIAHNKAKYKFLLPYPDVKETLEYLKAELGLKIAIVSDAPRFKAWQRLVISGLDKCFSPEQVTTYDDTGKHKPHRAPFRLALSRLGIRQPSRVMFVGDNMDRDMIGAARIGMKTCLARYGMVIKPTRKVRPDYELKHFKDIIGIARQLKK